MIVGKWIKGAGEGFEEALAIRKGVFCVELGVDEAYERDSKDEFSAHALIFDESGSPVATGRLNPDADGWHIGRLCVKKESRGQGFGDMALRMLLDRASQTVPDADIVISARVEVAPLYESFGFVKEGAEYVEAGMTHVKMRVNCVKIDWHPGCGAH
jgi:predicted GNAT family N-acyltransferase